MQTKLEKRLKHLNIPTPSQNLQDRCLGTIPSTALPQTTRLQKTRRPLKLQRAVMAGAFLFAAVAGVAFWSTRPSYDGKTMSPGSMAFAQVLEATSRVTFFHMKGRVLTPKGNGISSEVWSGMWLTECWYDTDRGFYTQTAPEKLLLSHRSPDLSKGDSLYNRTLFLPDGKGYMRGSQSNAVLAIPENMTPWPQFKNYLVNRLTDDVEGRINPSGSRNGPILSSTFGNWKGQRAQILVFDRQPSPTDAAKGVPPLQVHYYVNPQTKLVIAEQDFDVSSSDTPTLMSEAELDYDKPDSTIFDAKILTKDATISHDLKGVEIRKFPDKSHSNS